MVIQFKYLFEISISLREKNHFLFSFVVLLFIYLSSQFFSLWLSDDLFLFFKVNFKSFCIFNYHLFLILIYSKSSVCYFQSHIRKKICLYSFSVCTLLISITLYSVNFFIQELYPLRVLANVIVQAFAIIIIHTDPLCPIWSKIYF